MSDRPAPRTRADFRAFRALDTRWGDVDVFGHVNNVVYYAWFDSAVCGWLVEVAGADPSRDDTLTFVVETGCRYHEAIMFPQRIEVGLAVDRIGRSSVTYRLGVFPAGEERCAARGHFTHVYVARDTRRPVPIPDTHRRALQALVTA